MNWRKAKKRAGPRLVISTRRARKLAHIMEAVRIANIMIENAAIYGRRGAPMPAGLAIGEGGPVFSVSWPSITRDELQKEMDALVKGMDGEKRRRYLEGDFNPLADGSTP